jgi:hypothetical protein
MSLPRIGSIGAAGLLGALLSALSGISQSSSPTTTVPPKAHAAQRGAGIVEAALTGGDDVLGTIEIAGLSIDVNQAVMHTPSGLLLSIEDVLGPSLPGKDEPGLVGTGAMAHVFPTLFGAQGVDVLFDPAHNLLLGPLTRNDAGGTGPQGRQFEVMGMPVVVAVDPRLDPFQALVGGALPVDLATVPLGSLVEVGGYPGNDGQFYASMVITDAGTPLTGGAQYSIAIDRARCRRGDLSVRGLFSATTGNVEILDELGRVLVTVPVDPLDGTFAARSRSPECSATIVARHVETGTESDPFIVTVR